MRRALRLLPLVALAVFLAACGGSRKPAAEPAATTTATKAHAVRRPAPPRRPEALVERPAALLPAPLQDGAAAGSLVLGGLDAADSSTDGILLVGAGGARQLGRLSAALHDAAAARIGDAVYLFGGGDATHQLDDVLRVAGGRATVAGRLPAPASDVGAAAVGGTAYVVGGFTGAAWLDTIVAWRPGAPARVIARLPVPLRYAAVAAAGGRVVIAGGSTPAGTASAAVLSFDPRTGRIARIGSLPAPTTHATAAAFRDAVYVVGGRGAAVGTPIARVVAVDPLRRLVVRAGTLTSPVSDASALSVAGGILLVGGRGRDGTRATISKLVPASLARRVDVHAAANVYAADRAGALSPKVRGDRSLVYVPNSLSDSVDVVDPRTYRVVRHFAVGGLPQHVVPSWDLRTLYVTNDTGNSLTLVDPRTGKPGRTIPVDDPYNMYFTPDGRYSIVVAERLARLDFRDAHTFALHRSLPVPCRGIDHMDFSADGAYLLASCEFSGQLVKVDVRTERLVGVLSLRPGAMPQDVKLSPDGRVFYVADMAHDGLWEVDGPALKVIGFLPTGRGVHGLYPSRDARYLYATNRGEGTISVISFATRRVVKKWVVGGSPDMGGVSADGRVLWLSSRYDGHLLAISTVTGKVLARIPVGAGPHGVCVWPQPGRYSLGHTGILR